MSHPQPPLRNQPSSPYHAGWVWVFFAFSTGLLIGSVATVVSNAPPEIGLHTALWLGVIFGLVAYLITLALGLFELPPFLLGPCSLVDRMRRHAREHAERQRLKQAARALHGVSERWGVSPSGTTAGRPE